MKTKRTPITKRHISKILGRPVMGWNDRRQSHNRIKLTEQLTFKEMVKLENELTLQFPEYRIFVGDVLWRTSPGGKHVVTAVRFWKNPKDLLDKIIDHVNS